MSVTDADRKLAVEWVDAMIDCKWRYASETLADFIASYREQVVREAEAKGIEYGLTHAGNDCRNRIKKLRALASSDTSTEKENENV